MQADSAPIAFFAFNRPLHTARTLTALAANREAPLSDLHIFVDGPRSPDDQNAVNEVIQVVRAVNGFRTVTLEVSERNRGLYAAITMGVSEILKSRGSVIVIEDDILVSEHFLRYMNDALARYKDSPTVGSIHGYAAPIDNLPDFYFLRGGDCWGWATWSDRWRLFDPDATSLLRQIVGNRQIRMFCRSHGYRSLLMLLKKARGGNKSWAILWHASLFLAGKYTLHPGNSFVENIGNDGSGVHSSPSEIYNVDTAQSYHGLRLVSIEENRSAGAKLSNYLDSGEALVFRPFSILAIRAYAIISSYRFFCHSKSRKS